jgi:putative membrane protein insertion efficiency factor
MTVLLDESPGDSHPTASKLRPHVRAAVGLVVIYQQLRAGRPSPCRFWPSCSQYAREALEGHGLWRGTLLAAKRLGRCRPLGPHGVDPVPEPRGAR